MIRQPTIVVSPVGWESEMAGEGEVEGDDEDGYTARALYDYQAAAPDEISFDPDDIITNIVMVSVECKKLRDCCAWGFSTFLLKFMAHYLKVIIVSSFLK